MSKFEKNLTLSYKEIRGKRAAAITEDVRIAQDDYIRVLTDKKRVLERNLMDLEDLSPDSEMSLHPGRKEFDANRWVGEVNSTKLELVLLERELGIALETKQEFFGETKTTAKTAK